VLTDPVDDVCGAIGIARKRLEQMQSDFAHMNRVSMMGELSPRWLKSRNRLPAPATTPVRPRIFWTCSCRTWARSGRRSAGRSLLVSCSALWPWRRLPCSDVQEKSLQIGRQEQQKFDGFSEHAVGTQCPGHTYHGRRTLQQHYPGHVARWRRKRRIAYSRCHGANLKPTLIPIPFAAWYALAWFAEMLPSAAVTRNQVELMQVDNVAS
jgi:hypothetical protein